MISDEYKVQDQALYQTVAPFLREETLLWVGKPSAKNYRPNLLVLIFMLFWTGFAVFWTVSATATGGAFGLFGIPFLCVGGLMLYTVIFGQRRQLEKTVYAITESRALILKERRQGTDCVEYVFRNLQSVNLTSLKGASGTICFVPQSVYYHEPYRRGFRYRWVDEIDTAFLMIEDVQRVYLLISERISEST